MSVFADRLHIVQESCNLLSQHVFMSLFAYETHISDDTVILCTYSTILAGSILCSALLQCWYENMCLFFRCAHWESTKMPKILVSINYQITVFSLLFCNHVVFHFSTLKVSLQAALEFKEAEIYWQENHFEMLVSCSVCTVVYDGWFER